MKGSMWRYAYFCNVVGNLQVRKGQIIYLLRSGSSYLPGRILFRLRSKYIHLENGRIDVSFRYYPQRALVFNVSHDKGELSPSPLFIAGPMV